MTEYNTVGKIDFPRVAPHLVETARAYQSAVLCDVAGRRGALHARIQALNPAMKVVGPAFTVEVRPGDNLMFHLALALAQPGDVIVVDGKADSTCALFGELMVTQSRAAGHAGFVVDAAARDTATIANDTFPVFACGRNPCGPTKGLAGTIGRPISIGGIAVHPGDLIVGDADGVVAIPLADVERVLAAADAKRVVENRRLGEIERGELVSPWLESALRSAGLAGLLPPRR